jgi:RimJ/RimL family protein N-acetyltransferase
MTVLETDRLILRELTLADAPFILDLLTDPAWLRFIGDKGVRTLDDAHDYISQGPLLNYERLGFGLYLTQLKAGAILIGLCGLVKRPTLPDVDVGFAFLPQFRSQGYGFEAASAVLAYGYDTLRLRRIVAVVAPDNDASIKLIEKLGLTFERMVKLSDDGSESKLFVPAIEVGSRK